MNRLARWARAEWGLLYVTVREPLAKRRWRAIPMTIGAVLLTALLQFVQNQSWGYQFVQDAGAVRAVDPLWLALLRTPLSLFVPALDLPVWGRAGPDPLRVRRRGDRPRPLAHPGHRLRRDPRRHRLYARLGIRLGFDNPFGLPSSDRLVVDTGPSAAVVGLAVFIAWRYGAYVTALAVTAAMAIEVMLKGNLAGKEHLAAIIAVGLLCLISAVRHRGRPLG